MILGGKATSRYDAVFVNAPLKDYDKEIRRNQYTLPVLGLGYLATFAATCGHNVGVLDAEACSLGPQSIAAILNKAAPRWVGFNLLAPTYRFAVATASLLNPEIAVMLGGHHAKAMPQAIISDRRFPRIDALILGEAEYRCEAILREPNSVQTLPLVLFRGEDGTGKTGNGTARLQFAGSWTAPDINKLPFLDRGFFMQDPMLAADGRIEANIVGSRGCPYDCSFCGAAKSANPYVTIRTRAPSNIIAELTDLHTKWNVTAFRFVDDLFLTDVRFMRKCLNAFIEQLAADEFVWDATGRINVLAKADDSLFQLIKNAGCREIALGIESGSARILKYIDKHVTPAMTKRVVEKLTAHGISVKGYAIMGLPTETVDELRETYTHIQDLWNIADAHDGDFRCSVFEFRPYPGTPEWTRLLQSGRFSEAQLMAYEHIDLTNAGATVDMIERDEFNFSVNIQFGDAPVSLVRELMTDLMMQQKARTRAKKVR